MREGWGSSPSGGGKLYRLERACVLGGFWQIVLRSRDWPGLDRAGVRTVECRPSHRVAKETRPPLHLKLRCLRDPVSSACPLQSAVRLLPPNPICSPRPRKGTGPSLTELPVPHADWHKIRGTLGPERLLYVISLHTPPMSASHPPAASQKHKQQHLRAPATRHATTPSESEVLEHRPGLDGAHERREGVHLPHLHLPEMPLRDPRQHPIHLGYIAIHGRRRGYPLLFHQPRTPPTVPPRLPTRAGGCPNGPRARRRRPAQGVPVWRQVAFGFEQRRRRPRVLRAQRGWVEVRDQVEAGQVPVQCIWWQRRKVDLSDTVRISWGLWQTQKMLGASERSIREAEASAQEARRLVMRRPVGKRAARGTLDVLPRRRYSTERSALAEGGSLGLKIHKRAAPDIRIRNRFCIRM